MQRVSLEIVGCAQSAAADTDGSWGGMLSDEGRRYMERAPSLAFWPGFCLALVVYCLNMFGDTLRDLLDPRLRGASGRLGGRSLTRRHARW